MFISGGSRGIGLAIAKRAAQDGAKVALIAKAEGITLVLDKGEAMYVDSALDLTQRISAELK